MATPERTSTTSSPSTASREHGAEERVCLLCFQTCYGDMGRHMINCKVAKERYPDCDFRKKLGARNEELFDSALENMGYSLFFSLTEIRKKEFYSPYELAQLLQSFGHCLVPKEFDHVYVRRPVYNGLTDRNFKKELKEEDERLQMEAVKARELQKRRATITTAEAEENRSVFRPVTKQGGKHSGNVIDSPVVRSRDNLRGQTRSTKSFDEDKKSSQPVPSSMNKENKDGRPRLMDKQERDIDLGLKAFPCTCGKGKTPMHGKNMAKKSKIKQESETTEKTAKADNGTASGKTHRARRVKRHGRCKRRW